MPLKSFKEFSIRIKNRIQIVLKTAFNLQDYFKSSFSDNFKSIWYKIDLRWLKRVSITKILMGCYSPFLSLAATIMVSKHCPTISEHSVVLFIT